MLRPYKAAGNLRHWAQVWLLELCGTVGLGLQEFDGPILE